MAYRDRRVRAVAQYKLIDEASLSSFQSGLRFLDGRAKPAYDAYRLPIWVSGRGSRLRVYGQVRPARRLDAAGRPDPEPPAQRRGLHDGHHADGALAQGPVPARVPKRAGVWRLQGRADLARGAGRTPMNGGRARAVAARARSPSPRPSPRAAARTSRSGWRTSGCCSPSPCRRRARSRAWRPRASTSCASTRAGSRSRPAAARCTGRAGFDPANHRSRRYDWETLDRAIDLTRAAGMRVMLSVTGPGPLWTSRAPRGATRATSRARRCSRSSPAPSRRATATASTAT